MKESHSEGVANHTDPESCGKTREGLAEALAGGGTGRDIEPRNFYFGKPPLWLHAEGNNRGAANARHIGSREAADPGT
jgi:RNA-directed DNA polymerase